MFKPLRRDDFVLNLKTYRFVFEWTPRDYTYEVHSAHIPHKSDHYMHLYPYPMLHSVHKMW